MKTYPVPSDTLQQIFSILQELPFRNVCRVMGQLEQIVIQVDGLPTKGNPWNKSDSGDKTNSNGSEAERTLKRVNN